MPRRKRKSKKSRQGKHPARKGIEGESAGEVTRTQAAVTASEVTPQSRTFGEEQRGAEADEAAVDAVHPFHVRVTQILDEAKVMTMRRFPKARRDIMRRTQSVPLDTILTDGPSIAGDEESSVPKELFWMTCVFQSLTDALDGKHGRSVSHLADLGNHGCKAVLQGIADMIGTQGSESCKNFNGDMVPKRTLLLPAFVAVFFSLLDTNERMHDACCAAEGVATFLSLVEGDADILDATALSKQEVLTEIGAALVLSSKNIYQMVRTMAFLLRTGFWDKTCFPALGSSPPVNLDMQSLLATLLFVPSMWNERVRNALKNFFSKLPIVPEALTPVLEPFKVLLELNPTSTRLEALQACGNCNATARKASFGELLLCSRCEGAFFCSLECQRSAWSKHRETCENVFEIGTPRDLVGRERAFTIHLGQEVIDKILDFRASEVATLVDQAAKIHAGCPLIVLLPLKDSHPCRVDSLESTLWRQWATCDDIWPLAQRDSRISCWESVRKALSPRKAWSSLVQSAIAEQCTDEECLTARLVWCVTVLPMAFDERVQVHAKPPWYWTRQFQPGSSVCGDMRHAAETVLEVVETGIMLRSALRTACRRDWVMVMTNDNPSLFLSVLLGQLGRSMSQRTSSLVHFVEASSFADSHVASLVNFERQRNSGGLCVVVKLPGFHLLADVFSIPCPTVGTEGPETSGPQLASSPALQRFARAVAQEFDILQGIKRRARTVATIGPDVSNTVLAPVGADLSKPAPPSSAA